MSALAFGQMPPRAEPVLAPPMTLEEMERVAMANNQEIRAAEGHTAVIKTRTAAAGALDDPTLMYRDWGTPLAKPWDLNQSQQMLMYQQTLPGRGKRGARTEVVRQQIAEGDAQVEMLRREISVRLRKSYYDLLRSVEEHRIHDRQMELARQALQSATVKYTVGRVPQQDVLKAQIVMTRLAEHLVMLDEETETARAELDVYKRQA